MTSLYNLLDFDEVEKCINIARTAFESGDREKAERFAQKAVRMQPASETARALSARIRASDVQNTANNNIHPWSKSRQNPQYVNFSAEVNKNEAEKCLDLAENALLSGNLEKAERLVQKAKRMCPTQRATDLLNQIKIGEVENSWNRRSVKNSRPFSNIYNNNNSGLLNSMANKEDADKCIEVAQIALNAGYLDKAERFLEKAQRFCHTTRGKDLLQQVLAAKKNVPNGDGRRSLETPRVEQMPKVTTPPRNERPLGAIPKREPPANDNRKRPLYTEEQVDAIRHVKDANNDYDILGVARQCSKADIKKAYRKLTTLLHPDKNKAAGAKEAFMKITDAMERLLKVTVG